MGVDNRRIQHRLIGLGEADFRLNRGVGCGRDPVFCSHPNIPRRDPGGIRTSNETAKALMGLTLLPSVVILIGGIWFGERWAGRDERLRCPHCNKVLTGMRHLVVPTRNCRYCGRQILAEPEPEP